jgi:hypothetical protein
MGAAPPYRRAHARHHAPNGTRHSGVTRGVVGAAGVVRGISSLQELASTCARSLSPKVRDRALSAARKNFCCARLGVRPQAVRR